MIKDFYIYTKNIFNKDNINNNAKIVYAKLDPSDCIKQIYKLICQKEIFIDKLIMNIKQYENNDKFKFANNFDNGKFKLVLNSRKTEAPYHKPKKIVKEKIVEKAIEQIENKELLQYDEEE